MREMMKDDKASVNPVLMFILTLFVCGLLYSILFLMVFQPMLESYIPASDSKTLMMTLMYAIPLFIVLVGIVSVFKTALKKQYSGGGFG